MARQRLKVKSPGVNEALEIALKSGAMSVEDACRAMRLINGLSQEAFAHSVGVSLKVVKAIEAGVANPKLSSLRRLAEAANLRVVFAAPNGSVRIGDMRNRASEEQSSRERDFEAVASGMRSEMEVSAANSLGMAGFSYSLPQNI